MPFFTERLDGGLVTSRDPALLAPGELSAMQNCTYRRGSQALQRYKGRFRYGNVSATACDVNGLRDIQFDNGNHYLIGMATVTGTGRLRFSRVPFHSTATGSFTDVGNVTGFPGPTGLEVVHYRNRFFALAGATATGDGSTNIVVYQSATATACTPQGRSHGLVPVTASPFVTTAGGGSFSQSVTGYYEYWTTEVANITQDSAATASGQTILTLESSYGASPTTTFISATSVVPTIQRPTFRNSASNRWRIYRSPVKASTVATATEFPVGFMIAELASSVSAHADTISTTTSSYFFMASANGVSDSTTVYNDWVSAMSMSASGGAIASATTVLFAVKSQMVYGFNFSGISGAIQGIEVELAAYASAGACPVTVALQPARTEQGSAQGEVQGGFDKILQGAVNTLASRSASKTAIVTATGSGALQTINFGGSTDRWYTGSQAGLKDSDFNAKNVCLILSMSGVNTHLGVDYVKMRVTYSGSFDSVIPFPTVVYTFGEITSQVGKNFPPPNANTGDVYEDTLVLNDMSNSSIIRYSAPQEPEYFPPTYFLDFETQANDIVRLIRVVNNRLIVALDSSTWRVNYLPSERDASFDRGRAIEPISRSFGCISPMCACVFSIAGSLERLAFVSRQGIHTTDGYDFDTISDDLDWRKLIPVGDGIGSILAVNATPTAGGSGYTDGDLLTISGGDGTAQVKATVVAGAVTAVSLQPRHGSFYQVGTGNATTGGTGSGATIEITDVANVTPIALINNPEEHELVLFVLDETQPTETVNSFHFQYSTHHIKENDNLKISGPVHMRNYDPTSGLYAQVKSAWAVPRQTGESTIFLGYGNTIDAVASAAGAGAIYMITGKDIPSFDDSMSYTTRRMYLNGLGNELRVQSVRPYFSSHAGTPALAHSFITTKTGQPGEVVSVSPSNLTLKGPAMYKIPVSQGCEGLKVRMDGVGDHNDMAVDFLLVEGEEFGAEDSGRS